MKETAGPSASSERAEGDWALARESHPLEGEERASRQVRCLLMESARRQAHRLRASGDYTDGGIRFFVVDHGAYLLAEALQEGYDLFAADVAKEAAA